MANFANPTVGSNYTDFPVEIRASVDAALQQLSVGSHTNIPTGAIKFDTSANRWKKYNGSAFVDLTDTYVLNADLFVTQLNMGDGAGTGNNAIMLGASNDLRIYHDSNHSYIRDFSGTGNLKITTNQLDIVNNGNSEIMAKFIQNGSVELYENNVKRLETDTNGVQVTSRVGIGRTASRALDVEGNASIGAASTNDAELIIGRSGSGNRNAYIDWVGDNTYTDYGFRVIRFGGANAISDLSHRGTGNFRFVCEEAAQFQFLTSANTKAVITSAGRLGIGLTNPEVAIHTRDGGSIYALFGGNQNSDGSSAVRQLKLFTTGFRPAIQALQASGGSFAAVDLLLQPDGNNVGIGTTSPAGKLHISSGTSGDCELILEADTDNNAEGDNPRIIFKQDGGSEQSAIGTGNNQLEISNSVSFGGISFKTGTTTGYTNAVERFKILSDGNLQVPDNGKLVFGAGSDLQLYHNGSTSYITDSGTGSLIINSIDGSIHLRTNNTEEAIKCLENGGVHLYHNNLEKFTTTSIGASLEGNLSMTAELNLIGGSNSSRYIDSQTGNGAAHALHLRSVADGDASHQNMARFFGGGKVELYHANVKKFETTSQGALIETPGFATFHIKSTNNDAVLELTSNNDADKDWTIRNDYSANYDLVFRYNNTRKMDLDSGGNLSIVGDLHLDNGDRVVWGTSDTAFIQGDDNNYLIFGVNNERMRIHNDGQITIGATTISSGLAAVTSNFGQNGSDNMIGFMTYQNAHPNDTFNQAAIARSVSGGNTRDCHIGTYKVGSNNPAGYVLMSKRNGGNGYIWVDSGTKLRIATGVGNIGASAGTVVGTQSSDIRIKNNLGSVSYGLAEINKITPIKFTYKDDDENKQEIGFSAQDVQTVVPEAIYDTKDSREIDGTTIKNVLAMDYTSLIPVLVNAIKELSTEVNTLKSKIA
tara:strand:+ start:3756 stop:6548 length:2793 start_codon:yes stop_codon:yes gene_type:complete